MLADQREIGAPVRVRLEQRAPALLVVAALAMHTELARVSIAVTAGAGIGHRRVEALAVAGTARHVYVSAAQGKAGRIVVEAHLLPAIDPVAGAASGRPLGSARARLPGRHRSGRAFGGRGVLRRHRRDARRASAVDQRRPVQTAPRARRIQTLARLTARTPGIRRGENRHGSPRRRAAWAGIARSIPRARPAPSGDTPRRPPWRGFRPADSRERRVVVLEDNLLEPRWSCGKMSQPRRGRGGATPRRP